MLKNKTHTRDGGKGHKMSTRIEPCKRVTHLALARNTLIISSETHRPATMIRAHYNIMCVRVYIYSKIVCFADNNCLSGTARGSIQRGVSKLLVPPHNKYRTFLGNFKSIYYCNGVINNSIISVGFRNIT